MVSQELKYCSFLALQRAAVHWAFSEWLGWQSKYEMDEDMAMGTSLENKEPAIEL